MSYNVYVSRCQCFEGSCGRVKCFFCVLLSTAAEPISGLLSTFKLVLLEHMILCRMVQGQMPQAIKEVHFAISVLFAIIFE